MGHALLCTLPATLTRLVSMLGRVVSVPIVLPFEFVRFLHTFSVVRLIVFNQNNLKEPGTYSIYILYSYSNALLDIVF